jgi:phage shock protein A
MKGPLLLLLQSALVGVGTVGAFQQACVARRSADAVSAFVPHCRAAAPAAPRAAVSANMADRFVRLVKANVNKALSNAEDPEKVLDQAVIDMQKDLVKIRQSYAEVTASQRRMKEQMRAAEDEAQKWYGRAQLALEKGEEDLAREALERRRAQDDLAAGLATNLDRQDSSLTGLYDAMRELEARINEAKMKKDQYIARARTAKATTKVNDMLSDVGSSSAVAAFERMKDKVETLEAEAETMKDLKLMSGSKAPASMESRFKVRRRAWAAAA